ncbi:spore coat protein CotJB [Clostridium botulinum]|uniref:Polypeptide composition of the spore coat protein CotJB n=1 Tax=Clostridium botulinum C/D str. DC5 TaxID=1443128 RepID=A0A0A0I6S1_CLOBO|nr:spore coat protein CotJB [Clostridium botulinum]KEI00694.1 polypeptide composition of the spore coat protein CotJB [Clostridium botulinum C/D str. BKT75002]KEI08440.1 polypeptide composition of the spore coat protein CotJB [Clostridium botulinum C/D str. BKT2873]KGM96016.1 polypeptide composition of the spore coat protein CotJB [Clostridium botulinum C/D str. DC5]KGM98248.1 polypeptide composition of the spore coat protein CotJB [Clostridium botulinum D str. CCUG 7971]KOC50457.1 spore coat 
MDKMLYNNKSRNDLLRKITEVEFAAVDLNLYLDNHPEDSIALERFNEISRDAAKLRKAYEMSFGPLLNFGYSQSNSPWAWANDTWPWELEE